MTLSKDERPNRLWQTSVKAGGLITMLGSFAAVTLVGCPSGGVGDPCVPEDEYRENFAGFKLSEENIESRSFQCKTRICLVNHFQGRVSCPQGQAEPTNCSDDESRCGEGESCVEAGSIFSSCDPTPCGEPGANESDCNNSDGTNPRCGGQVCDESGSYCHCQTGDCPENYFCDQEDKLCKTRVCSIGDPDEDPDHCYVPGTNIPVTVEVCSQCASTSNRDADPSSESPNSVYCSCRCAPPADNPDENDEGFNFCECPEGFVCSEIRPNVGLGDPLLAGSYCVKEDTTFEENDDCGTVQGHWNTQCDGQQGGSQTAN